MRVSLKRQYIFNAFKIAAVLLFGPCLSVVVFWLGEYFRHHGMKDVSAQLLGAVIIIQAAFIGLLFERRVKASAAPKPSVPEELEALKLELQASRRQVEALRYQDQEQVGFFNSVLGNVPVGFAFINFNFEYVRVNNRLAEMLEVSREDLLGKRIGKLSAEAGDTLISHLQKVFDTKKSVLNKEVIGKLPSNPDRLRHWTVSLFPIFGLREQLLGAGLIVDETTEEKRIQDEVNYYATHDVLTGLPNRKVFEEYLENAIARAQSDNSKVAVLVLDLDRFKNINDSLGHEAGDQVMKEVAARLQANLHDTDMVARWGGDEFMIVLTNLQGLFEVSRVADRILKAFGPVIRLGQQTLHVSTTIGVAVYPRDGGDVKTLVKNGDAALYRAKELGKNRYEFYKAASAHEAGDQLTLETGLRRAIEADELRLYFQPIVELKTGHVIAAEALVRWQHPTLGLLRPRQFIPLAENVGLIVPLGKWILERAALTAQSWVQAGLGPLQVAVNLSPRQFAEDSLVPDVEAALAASGLDPKLLELEITESLAMENVDRTRNKIVKLNEMGVGITIDDFGTGYSSLSYLRSFPVGKLKIDKSFIRHSITEEQDSKIIRAICALADSLSLKVVAEGVDTEQQMGLLSSLGCYAAQGYYISKPLSAEEFSNWLRGYSSTNGSTPSPASAASEPSNSEIRG